MKPEQMTFADVTVARKRLAMMYPNAQQVRLVESGYDNIVGLVDDTYAARFPRNANAYQRNLHEREVLQNLKVCHDPADCRSSR